MDAQQALADLTEISSQIRAAVLIDDKGAVAASTLGGEQAARMAKAAGELLSVAERTRPGLGPGTLTQLEVATLEGSVFVVRDHGRVIAATTSAEPTVGLVFYDLKSALRASVGKKQEAPQAKSAVPAKPKTAAKRAPARKSPSSGSRGGSRPSRKRDAES